MKTIYKRFKDETEVKIEPLEKFIQRTEGSGYYKPGTALKSLEVGIVETNFALYSFNRIDLTL